MKVTFPGLSGIVYESVLEGGPFHMVLDSNKRVVLTGDCYPSTKKLAKGKNFTIRASLRHENLSFLEGMHTAKNFHAVHKIFLRDAECWSRFTL